MLSRKNLTLSALVLSNGLNLGTRSRAANADVNLDGQTLRILNSHHGVMREGMEWYSFSKPKSKPGIPSIPSSISPVQVQQPSCGQPQPGGWAVDDCVSAEARPADLVGRPERGVDIPDPRFQPSDSLRGMAIPSASDCKSRSAVKSVGKRGLKRTAKRAAAAAAAATMSHTFGK